MKWVATTALAVIVLLSAVNAAAQTAAISLSIPPTARANGMGQAYVALVNDASGAWWNPGSLGFRERQDVNLTHAQLVPDLANDVYYDFLAYALPLKGAGTVAASLVYLSYGESEATGPVGEPLGTFRSYEISPALSYGVALGNQLGIGVTFKYIRVQLAPDLPTLPPGSGTGSTVAADVGALWVVPALNRRLSLGAALQNVGPNIRFVEDDQKDPIYRNVKMGFAGTVYERNNLSVLLVGDVNQLLVKGEIRDPETDVVRRRYGKPIWNGGGEAAYTIGDVAVALRGGYVHDSDGAISDPTYGLGLGYKILRLDFASIPQAEDKESGTKLDRVQKFSLGARF